MNTIIEKIRAEIKIRLSANGAFDEEGDSAWHYDQGMIDAYNYILSFLSDLEKEEKPMNKDCNGCPHCVDRKDQYGWHFKGCFGGPYNGKFIAEIDECPLKQEQPDFPTTNEQVKEFLAIHPKVEVPQKYKTPDWIFEKSEKPMSPDDAMKELNEKIALVKQRGTWDGVDVDKYMDEVRGREPEKPMEQEGLEEEISHYLREECSNDDEPSISEIANHFAQWGAEHLKK